MYRVLKIDGPNLVTDKGCVSIQGFQYADGGKTSSVTIEDWKMMRQMFIAAPALLAAHQRNVNLDVDEIRDEGRLVEVLRAIITDAKAAILATHVK